MNFVLESVVVVRWPSPRFAAVPIAPSVSAKAMSCPPAFPVGQDMTWWSDYNVTYVEAGGNSCRMDIGAWVSIINQSGADRKSVV